MDEDTEMAAWAQLENEAQQYNEWLARDPAYADWLDSINAEWSESNEVQSDCIEGF